VRSTRARKIAWKPSAKAPQYWHLYQGTTHVMTSLLFFVQQSFDFFAETIRLGSR
jgi:hypothetical protein